MDKEYIEFCEKINRYIGINLLEYKENQMKRRLKSLYEKKGLKSFDDYFLEIQKNADTKEEFLDRITINVSEFFRNYPRWEILEKEILPTLVKNKRSINVWSAACSSGEEAYSLAMILTNFYSINDIKILATDIDEKILEKAKSGVYGEYAIKGCPTKYLDKYFKKSGNEYILDDSIKNCVKFKKHDLLKEPFEKNLDLIVCRNVMIYFTEEAKEKLYYKFGDSLSENGVLFVGSTEQIFQPQNYLLTTEQTFFYRKKTK